MTDSKTETKKDTSQANRLYTAASTALREKHREEFDALLDAEYEKAGLKRVKRLSAEERAEREAAERKAKADAKEAARKEKALAAAQALASEFPDLIVVNQPIEAVADDDSTPF